MGNRKLDEYQDRIAKFHEKLNDHKFKSQVKQLFDESIQECCATKPTQKPTKAMFESWYDSMSRYLLGVSTDAGWHSVIYLDMVSIGTEERLARIIGGIHDNRKMRSLLKQAEDLLKGN